MEAMHKRYVMFMQIMIAYIATAAWPIRTLFYTLICMLPVRNNFIRKLNIPGLKNYKTIENRRDPNYVVTEGVKFAALFWLARSKVTTDSNKNRHEAVLAENTRDYQRQLAILRAIAPNCHELGLGERQHTTKRQKLTHRFPRHFQGETSSQMFKSYRKLCADEGKHAICKERFTKSRPFFVKIGRESDRINCLCSLCGNWYGLKHALEKGLGKGEIRSDDLFSEFEDYIQDLRAESGFKTNVELFLKDENERLTFTVREYTSDQIADLLLERRDVFENHRLVRDADKRNSEIICSEYLTDPRAIVVDQDFSENMTIRHMRSPQGEFMKPVTFLLHVTIVRYLTHKFYLYTLMDDVEHKPEIPACALKKAVDHVQKQYDAYGRKGYP